MSLWSSKYSKTCVKRPLSKIPNIGFKTNYRLMSVKSIAEGSIGEPSAILLTNIKLPFVIKYVKIFVLSIFEWPFYAGFIVYERLLILIYFRALKINI